MKNNTFYQIACEAIEKVQNGAAFVETLHEAAKNIFDSLDINAPYVRYTFGTGFAAKHGVDSMTMDVASDRFSEYDIYDILYNGAKEGGLTCLEIEGAEERIRKPEAKHFLDAVFGGEANARAFDTM